MAMELERLRCDSRTFGSIPDWTKCSKLRPAEPARGRSAVIVEQVWTANAYRNFNYLVACPDSGEAILIVCDVPPCESR